MLSLHRVEHQMRILLFVSLCTQSEAWAYLVKCGTSMTSAGHRRYTAQGGGSIVLKRGSTVLACGSNLNPNEQLSLSSSGTSGYVNSSLCPAKFVLYVKFDTNMAGDLLYEVTGAATIAGGSCSSTRSTSSSATVKAGTSGSVQMQVNSIENKTYHITTR
jgi:hypothetical protein